MNSDRDTPQVALGGWVAPFGDPGITDRSHLPRAFRSVPRPSSPLSAKASTRCPFLRLIPGVSVAAEPHVPPGKRRITPPRTGAKPQPRVSGAQALAKAGAHGHSAASHEDTSSDTSSAP